MRCLWDSDVLSEFLRARNAVIQTKARVYLNRHGRADISLFTRYEVLRGYKARRASRLMALLELFCRNNFVLLLNPPIVDLACDIWADLSRRGVPIGDIDPIIAATALHHGLGIATRNVAHFSRIPGLTIEDWSLP